MNNDQNLLLWDVYLLAQPCSSTLITYITTHKIYPIACLIDIIHYELNMYKMPLVCPKFHIVAFGTIIELYNQCLEKFKRSKTMHKF